MLFLLMGSFLNLKITWQAKNLSTSLEVLISLLSTNKKKKKEEEE